MLSYTVPHARWASVISDNQEGLFLTQNRGPFSKVRQEALQVAHWTSLRKKGRDRNRVATQGLQGFKKHIKVAPTWEDGPPVPITSFQLKRLAHSQGMNPWSSFFLPSSEKWP